MKIEKLNSFLPDSSFCVYKIFIGDFDYTNVVETATTRYLGKHTLQNFLVGLNPKNGEIKFISGQFFLSAIAEEFNINLKKPESFIPYLQWSTFFIGGTNISYWKKRHKKMLFNGNSDILNKRFTVSVNLKEPDDIHVTVH